MTPQPTFATLLEQYVNRDGRHVRQLEQAIIARYGQQARVPHNTISRWLRGDVQRPRQRDDVLRLAVILQLTEPETDALLAAAGHDPLAPAAAPGALTADLRAAQLSVVAPPAAAPFQPPPRLPTFVGRRRLVADVKSALRRPPHFVCLQGMGGVGKTSLALHLAYEMRPHFPDGVLWVWLDRAEPMAALQNLATAYGIDVSAYTDLSSRSGKVRELLAHRRALLVLDDAPNDDAIRPLLPPSGDCAVLLTTRRHDLAAADAATRFTVPPFAPAAKESLDLFDQVLGRAHTSPETAARAAIADLLGHLPLAVDIAAQRIRHEPDWQTAAFLARLQDQDQRLPLLARGDRAVHASFALSVERMPPADQTLFAALGVLGGAEFDAPAAAAVADLPTASTADGLRRLHALSLLQAGQNGRYRLHPLLRDFCLALADPADYAPRMVHYFVALAAAAAPAALDANLPQIAAALELAAAHGLAAALINGSQVLVPHLLQRGLLDQAHEILLRAEKAARAAGDAAALSSLLHHLGQAALKQGDVEAAEIAYQEAIDLARQEADDAQQSTLLLKMGGLAHRRGRFQQAAACYQEGLALAQAAENRRQQAAFLINLGLLAAVRGDVDAASSYYEEAQTLARQLEEKSLLIHVHQNWGSLRESHGDYAQAKTHYESGLALARELEQPELVSRMLGNVGLIACSLGNLTEAAAHFRQGLALAEKSGLRQQMCRQRANLGQVATLRQAFSQAQYHYQEALAIARALDFPEDVAVILNQQGNSWLKQEAYQKAAAVFEEALALSRAHNIRRETAVSLFGLAQAAVARGNLEAARQLGAESEQIFAALGHRKASELRWWLAELPGEPDNA